MSFIISTEGIDRESFRFFLTNQTGITNQRCAMPLWVTPSGEMRELTGPTPVLKNVQIAR